MDDRRGFTLLEILVAIGITALLVATAVQIFQGITFTQQRARPDRHRDREAAVFLDRFERELVGTTLFVKPDRTDRLAFPWVFVAEDRVLGTNDSDRVRFITQTPARAPARTVAGLRQVSYGVEGAEFEDALHLFRLEEHLSQGLAKEIRLYDAEPVLEDVYRFALRFESEQGGWRDDWDSTDVAMLDALPQSVEVLIQLNERDEAGERIPGTEQTRRVALPVRPFASYEPEESERDSGCPDGPTIEECLDRYTADIERLDSDEREELYEAVSLAGEGCWNDPDPSDELIELWDSFDELVGIDAEEACL